MLAGRFTAKAATLAAALPAHANCISNIKTVRSEIGPKGLVLHGSHVRREPPKGTPAPHPRPHLARCSAACSRSASRAAAAASAPLSCFRAV